MPWCDTCDVYLAPNTVDAEGACPTCGDTVDQADRVQAASPEEAVPWHFWVVVVAVVAYLGWRLIDGIGWLAERL